LAKPRLRWTFLFAGIAQGISFLVDAFHLLRGTGTEVLESRPWTGLVERVGIDPLTFGPVCLVFGIAWLVVTIAILRGLRGAFRPAVIIAVASLWHIVVGTALALVYLLALMTLRGQEETE
jgi:hypothetical protein